MEKSLLAIQKILGLLVHTLPTNGKYYLVNKNRLTQPIQMQILKKNKKKFDWFFSAFLKSRSNFEQFEEKRWPSKLIYFRNYGLQKTGSDKCLEGPLTSNMVNDPKDCRNLHHSTFFIFIDDCAVNWVWKRLC